MTPVRQFFCHSCGKVVPVLYGARPLRCACGQEKFGELHEPGVFLLPDDMQTIPVAAPGERAIPLDKKPEWKPMQEVPSKMTARDAIAHCLLMGRGMYQSPEEWADAVLKRLAHEGFAVLRKEVETDVR